MIERRYVRIEDRKGTRLPFSKGVLSGSLMSIGIVPEDAYGLAEAIEDGLIESEREAVAVDELIERVERAVRERLGEAEASSWVRWVEARRSGIPVIVFLGGGTGVGKSTVATRLAARLGVTRVVATDSIREIMRGLYPEQVMPTLHVSSFEAHHALRAPVPADHDAVVEGFRQQAELVVVGVTRLVDRAVKEQTDLIVEGAHLIPGTFTAEWERWGKEAAVCKAVLSVSQPESHRAHFLSRLERVSAREPRRYLDNFDEIRRIQRYIVQQAAEHGVPRFEVERIDEAIQRVLDCVVDAVLSARERAVQGGGGSPS